MHNPKDHTFPPMITPQLLITRNPFLHSDSQWKQWHNEAKRDEAYTQPLGLHEILRLDEGFPNAPFFPSTSEAFVDWTKIIMHKTLAGWLGGLGSPVARQEVGRSILWVAVHNLHEDDSTISSQSLLFLKQASQVLKENDEALAAHRVHALTGQHSQNTVPQPLLTIISSIFQVHLKDNTDSTLLLKSLLLARKSVLGSSLVPTLVSTIYNNLNTYARRLARRNQVATAIRLWKSLLTVVVSPKARAALLHSGAATLRGSGDDEGSEIWARLCIQEGEKADSQILLGTYRMFLVQLLEKKGALEEAAPLVVEALHNYRQAYGDDHREVNYILSRAVSIHQKRDALKENQ